MPFDENNPVVPPPDRQVPEKIPLIDPIPEVIRRVPDDIEEKPNYCRRSSPEEFYH